MSRRLFWMRLGLVVLVLLTFSPVMTAEFVRWDDRFTLHHNPRLNPPSWNHLASYWSEWRQGEFGLYIPFTYTVWSGLAWVGRVGQPDPAGIDLNPWIFHIAAVLLHASGALIVFELLFALVRNRLAALIAAALWAVHPVQVEPVAWASGMKDVQSGVLSLGAIWLYARAATSQRDGTKRLAYTGCIAAFVLALLSKPSAVVVGPICLVIDALILRRPLRQAAIASLPLFLLAVPAGLIARNVQYVDYVTPVELWARPLIAGDTLAFYFGKILFPLHLAVDYGRSPEVVRSGKLAYFIWIVPVALGVMLWLSKQRLLQAAGLIFVLALGPVLGFFTFQFQLFSGVADHYLYVAMLGPAMALAWLLANSRARFTTIAAAAILLALSARSFAQAMNWRDDFVLLPHVLSVNPRSFAAHNNLGVAYDDRASLEQWWAEQAREAGDSVAARGHRQNQKRALEQAIEHFSAAVRIRESYDEARGNAERIRRVLEQFDAPATTRSVSN